MEEEQGDNEVPPVAGRFLERHRPAQNRLGSAGRDTGGDNDEDEDNDEARDLGEADGELEIECPGVDGVPDVAVGADLGVPAPPTQLFAPRPRAKGVAHPPVPTRAQVERHALEQHVNYAPLGPHCLQASSHEETPTCCWGVPERADGQRRLLCYEGSGGRFMGTGPEYL